MPTIRFGDFEWDEEKAEENLRKHSVSFEEAASVFLDLDYLLIADVADPERLIALGFSSVARILVVVHCERRDTVRIISARAATQASVEPMSNEKPPIDPSAESLSEIPEIDFEKGIRPNRYANLRGDFHHVIVLDRELWEHFGSQEKVVEALTLLVDVARRSAA